jgi:hypothetical protein
VGGGFDEGFGGEFDAAGFEGGREVGDAFVAELPLTFVVFGGDGEDGERRRAGDLERALAMVADFEGLPAEVDGDVLALLRLIDTGEHVHRTFELTGEPALQGPTRVLEIEHGEALAVGWYDDEDAG